MKLTLEQIKSITTGAVCVEKEEDKIRFHRFTDQQEILYGKGKKMNVRCAATAGVKFRFKTNSRTLKLKFEMQEGSSRRYYSFDVFVNGKDCGVVWCAPWKADVSAALRKGENEIEIRYTNNWYNRLVGDCFLKPDERVTRSTLRYWKGSCVSRLDKDRLRRRTRYSGPSADDPLQPSGIVGPVALEFAETR